MAFNLLETEVSIPRANIEEYKWCLYSVPKGGKTTLFVKLVQKQYGDIKKGFIIKTEEGTKGLVSFGEKANSYKDVVEIVDQLIKHKEKLGVKIVAIDTIDKMYEYAREYILKKKSIEDGKKYIAVNDIPWGKGWEMINDAIMSQLERLENAGYGIFVIAHDKTKKFESRDGVSYDQVTIDMHDKLRGAVLNFCDFITFIDIAKEADESGNIKDKRYIYFRSNGSDIVAGSRFEKMPEKIEYDIDQFIEAFEDGVNHAFDGVGVDVKKAKKKQAKQTEEKSKKFIAEDQKIPAEELTKTIKEKYVEVEENVREEVKKIMSKHNIADFKNPEELSYEGLLEIIKLLE